MLRLLPLLFWLLVLPVLSADEGALVSEPLAPTSAVASEPLEPTSPTEPSDRATPSAAAPAPVAAASGVAAYSSSAPTRVLVIPVRDQIADPILYIIRRGLKSAGKNDLVVLDMETPGGRLDSALKIMEALDKFEGHTATYVNGEAISAGAFISAVTHDIYFAPKGVIGAAAAVSGQGEEIAETMRLKLNSYLKAKVRAYSEGRGYRGEVISSMMDKDFEFKIGETVIKAKGELLSLTDVEAAKTYGDPPQTLLSSGTYATLADLLNAQFGAGNYRIEQLDLTWSERLAQHITNYASIILGLGLLFLFIEFKTPGFGFFGITGGALLMIVFFGHYVAGLSGYEPALFFALGLLLLLSELVFFPGVIVVALTGVVLMFGSLLWSMVDHWPSQPWEFSSDMFVKPATNLLLGFAVTITLAILLAKFIPKGWFFNRIVVSGIAGSVSQVGGLPPEQAAQLDAIVGRRGVVATGLFPGGQIEIEGQRYEARLELGTAVAGTPVVVVRVSDFGLIVEVAQS